MCHFAWVDQRSHTHFKEDPTLSENHALNRAGAKSALTGTAIKVGVPNLETDLFTNVNKLCPTVTLRVPKLGNCLEMYACAQASAQFVHSMCTSLDMTCTLELLLGHFLYTGATAWALLVHYTGTAWPLLVQVL